MEETLRLLKEIATSKDPLGAYLDLDIRTQDDIDGIRYYAKLINEELAKVKTVVIIVPKEY